MNQSAIGLKGQVKVDVVDHTGRIVHEGKWQPNLILDHGLDKLADVSICDMFRVAVKGNDTIVMREMVAPANTYYQTVVGTSNVGIINRVAGRQFTAADIGKLIRSSSGKESIITSMISPGPTDYTSANVRGVGLSNVVAWGTAGAPLQMDIYSTQVTSMATEQGRTQTYSAKSGDNHTATSGAERTLQRAFLFDPEPENKETGGWFGTWSNPSGVSTITKGVEGRAFVGATAGANSDVGKYIQFTDTGEYAMITSVTNGTTVIVDRPFTQGPYSSVAFVIYGKNIYTHIGFSDTMTVGPNLNVMVRLNDGVNAAPVGALGHNPETPGQQVKVTYNLKVTFGPTTIQAANGLFFGDVGVMSSSNKNGDYVIEAINSSTILDDGSSDVGSVDLEPYAGGSVALAPPIGTGSNALVPLTPTSPPPPDRSAGVQVVPMIPDPYSISEFSRLAVGTFGVSQGVGSNWRVLGIFDDGNQLFLLTFLWAVVQTKPATHQFVLKFRKSWNRDLTP